MVALLSHMTTSPGVTSHLMIHAGLLNACRVISPNNCSLSSAERPMTRCSVSGEMFRTRSPVSGWRVTSGCSLALSPELLGDS
eukprot:COSAG06_NODE_851_length_11957_cov_6.770048_6_plen_83_part_00